MLFPLTNHATGLTSKGAYEAIVEVQTIWKEHPCPSHSSTDRAPSCFPVLFSPGFVFCCEPWLLLWEFKDDPFIHLAVIYWVPFSALAGEQQPRQKIHDPVVFLHIPVDTRQHAVSHRKAWAMGCGLGLSDSFYLDCWWVKFRNNSVVHGLYRIQFSVSYTSKSLYKYMWVKEPECSQTRMPF